MRGRKISKSARLIAGNKSFYTNSPLNIRRCDDEKRKKYSQLGTHSVDWPIIFQYKKQSEWHWTNQNQLSSRELLQDAIIVMHGNNSQCEAIVDVKEKELVCWFKITAAAMINWHRMFMTSTFHQQLFRVLFEAFSHSQSHLVSINITAQKNTENYYSLVVLCCSRVSREVEKLILIFHRWRTRMQNV